MEDGKKYSKVTLLFGLKVYAAQLSSVAEERNANKETHHNNTRPESFRPLPSQ